MTWVSQTSMSIESMGAFGWIQIWKVDALFADRRRLVILIPFPAGIC